MRKNATILFVLALLLTGALVLYAGKAPAPSYFVSLSSDTTTVLDLNEATAHQLATLPGIGETIAQRIVQYREEHGPFAATEEIMNVSGIGPAKYEKIRQRLTVRSSP